MFRVYFPRMVLFGAPIVCPVVIFTVSFVYESVHMHNVCALANMCRRDSPYCCCSGENPLTDDVSPERPLYYRNSFLDGGRSLGGGDRRFRCLGVWLGVGNGEFRGRNGDGWYVGLRNSVMLY